MRPAGRPSRWALVRRGTALAGCLVLSTCLTLPGTATPRAAAAPPPDTPTTQVLSSTATAPASTTGPSAATSATTTASTDADSADAALGDAVVLTRALDEGDDTALVREIGRAHV